MVSLQEIRTKFQPKLPKIFSELSEVSFQSQSAALNIDPEIKKRFPHTNNQSIVQLEKASAPAKPIKVGVVFSGGQASGGHNVIAGLFDALKKIHPESKLFGFLNGPSGIIDNHLEELTEEKINPFRNIGGFDLIGSGRTKIETPEQFASSLTTAKTNRLDGIVIIGGDDSNTNAALLAEYFRENKCSTKVIGVPKTIDGDLRNEHIEISFGFDTACKVYSEMIGNIGKDALSAKKYYHFIKLMGRSASHIAVECALKTQPNWVFIGEEVAKEAFTLQDIGKQLADIIEKRAKDKKNYGLILIPEGLIEFIPEMKKLIQELNEVLASGSSHEKEINALKESSEKKKKILSLLSKESAKCLSSLPEKLQDQLLLDRDPHGNVQVSHIETEKLLIELAKNELQNRKFTGKFNPVQHFFGYEGRSGLPSNFDAQYCYSLGHAAALLIRQDLTGYICCIKNLQKPVEDWEALGLPITMFMNMEKRHGKEKPVIKKALVDLKSKAFLVVNEKRKAWAVDDSYLCPGPIQFEGELSITDSLPLSL